MGAGKQGLGAALLCAAVAASHPGAAGSAQSVEISRRDGGAVTVRVGTAEVPGRAEFDAGGLPAVATAALADDGRVVVEVVVRDRLYGAHGAAVLRRGASGPVTLGLRGHDVTIRLREGGGG